jgi:hypothetical protein
MRNTPVDSLALWRLWNSNTPYEDICEELNISKSQLFRMARQRGLKHRPRPPKWHLVAKSTWHPRWVNSKVWPNVSVERSV